MSHRQQRGDEQPHMSSNTGEECKWQEHQEQSEYLVSQLEC